MMNRKLLFTILLLLNISVYAQVQTYYDGLDLTKTGNELFLELSGRVISTHSGIPYTSSSTTDVWDACDQADEDPDVAANVLLIYGFDDTDGDPSTDRTRLKTLHDTGSGVSGVWNREHVFPKSLANPSLVAETDEITPGSDVHNLRPADRDRNTSRSNRKFTEGSGNSGINSSDGGWYPGDEWKGDVARIIMYMYLRYNGDGSVSSQTNCLPKNVGIGTINAMDSNMVDLFLKWNIEDPVSDFEANRNEVLAGIQNNRNPFIDNPYLATLIWGGEVAEDKWDMVNSSDAEAPTAPTNLVASNITEEKVDLSWGTSTDNIGVVSYLVYKDGTFVTSTPSTSVSVSGLDAATTYLFTVKARDAANNLSNASNEESVTTLEGPLVMFFENFNDCNSVQFTPYSEASAKDWTCYDSYGEDNSGSYGINGYQEAELSKDWLITTSPIDFDVNENELLSFYTDAAYGTTPLELVYSSNYDGVGNPADFTWSSVPNVSSLVHNNTSTEIVYQFTDVDISSITGSVYFAFKYYSDGVPTRWNVDNFEITATEPNTDADGDGVLDDVDNCPTIANADQADTDGDGIGDICDVCPNTPNGETVDLDGCSDSQLDDDNDGIMNNVDLCPDTPNGETVDSDGCSDSQLDDDNDGIMNNVDLCPDTPSGETVDSDGCSDSQLDDDNDGVMNNIDLCSNTPSGETVDSDGCSDSQLDDDNDGVMNNIDACPNTTSGVQVNEVGCFTLPSNNFSIKTVGETCAGENNGQLIITATENYDYTFSINGNNYSFTNTITVEDLTPNTYEICIEVVSESYEQCFAIIIEEAQEISGKTSVTSSKVSIEIESGTAPFKVFKNGLIIDETSSNYVEIEDVKQGDLIEVKSKISCEGTLSKTIEVFNEFVAYPNPSNGKFEIGIPVEKDFIEIQVYNAQSLLISSKLYKVNYGRINLDIENQPSGVYFIKVNDIEPLMLRVIKK